MSTLQVCSLAGFAMRGYNQHMKRKPLFKRSSRRRKLRIPHEPESFRLYNKPERDGAPGQNEANNAPDGAPELESFKIYRARPARPMRHKLHFTLVGDAGRLLRIIILCALALVLTVTLAVTLKREPQLMSMPEITSLADAGVLKVGVRENIPGMSNNGAGLEVELALMLAERLLPEVEGGNAVQYVAVNSQTAGPHISDGEINVAAAMMRRGGIASLTYSIPYYSDPCRFVIRTGERVTASGITVGCLQKSAEENMLEAYITAHPNSEVTAREYAAYTDMLSALVRRDIDAVVMTDVYIDLYDSDYAITSTGLVLGTVDYAFACAADSPAIAELATMMIQELTENGELAALLDKYGLEGADG